MINNKNNKNNKNKKIIKISKIHKNNNKIKSISKYYDEIAKGYNELHEDEQKSKHSKILKELLTLGLKNKSQLLDIGCGTGKSFDYYPCKIFGIEPSKKMVKQHPKHEELIKSGRLLLCEAQKIGSCFKDKKFDFIISVTAAHHYKEAEKTFIDIIRKLAKNGFAVFSLLKGTEKETEQIIKNKFVIYKKILPDNYQKDTILICTPKKC